MTPWLLATALAQPVLVELVDAGDEPLRALALSPTVGIQEQAVLELTLSARTQGGGMSAAGGDLPKLTLDLEAEVVEVDENIRYRLAVTNAAAASTGNEDLDPALAETLAPLVGMTGVVEVTRRGEEVQEDWSAPDGVDGQIVEELRKSMAFALPVLPAEPVGKGGKWTVTRPIDDQGFEVTQVETWTVAEMTGQGVTLHTVVKQQAVTGQPVTAGLPEGMVATLDRHLGIGEGAYVVDDGHLLPRSAVEGMTVKFKLAIDQDGEASQLSTIVGHELSLKRDATTP